ncbi:hypothetical protein LCI18_012899 [Fusarium solani-melongenae]|uniref:Uncharacterized protein n=1 Tax=Fusarium solani subsp. cucurbitae TaxID=2747967 RepID=A0ACD3ZKU6_FUSSC|nr:hypothetical protein LCI18_012899 [Fusarium solani-melongenae]
MRLSLFLLLSPAHQTPGSRQATPSSPPSLSLAYAPPARLSAMSSTEEATTPPEGYFVAECPNLAEVNTLCCPYVGCDGFMFHSAEEC